VLEARLGRGGFGTVYLAERGGRRYALKLLPLAGLGGGGTHELLMLARVRHPHVVRLLGHSYWPDPAPRFLVIVMEYVEGRRLDVWADAENPSAHAVLLRVRGVARALRALHGGRALHRDLKEANILVREADGEAVLVDLGVGSHEDTSFTRGGSLPPGTRAYLSPEAWRFHEEHRGELGAHYRSTPADDLYALGVVLYWLLTGRRPFHVGQPGDEAGVISRPPVAPKVRNHRVPEELGALCLRLLEKRPEQRPDAAELLATVEEQLGREEPEWHAPLCDFHDVHNVTTRPGPDPDETAAWLNEVREDFPPRRGRRPPRRALALEMELASGAPGVEVPLPAVEARLADGAPGVEAPLPAVETALAGGAPAPEALLPTVRAKLAGEAPVPEVPPPPAVEPTVADAPAPLAGMTVEHPPVEAMARHSGASGARRVWWSVVVPGLLAALCVVLAFHGGARRLFLFGERSGPGPDWKVASPERRPESTGAAAPPEAASTPAVIAAPAMPHKEPSPMTHTPAGTSPQPAPPFKGRSASGKTLKAAGAACLLGCTGAQVRGKPTPEPCPPGAIETMKSLDIRVGDREAWSFGGGNRILTVQEGWTSVFLPGSDFGDIPNGSMLSGRLIFGDRVYGRITQARLEGTDRTVPVCIELMNYNGERRGLDLEPGSTPTAPRVWSFGYIKAVSSFE
jgi:hypothetical protein